MTATRRYRCDGHGVEIVLTARNLAPNVIVFDVPRCALCPGHPEMPLVEVDGKEAAALLRAAANAVESVPEPDVG